MNKTIANVRQCPEWRTAPPKVVALRFALRGASRDLMSGRARTRPDRAAEYIRQLELQLNANPHLSVGLADLGFLLDLEPTYCCKMFRSITGKSFVHWLRSIRIQKAKKLLQDRALSVGQISRMVGYSNIRTFERSFQAESGMSPVQFRRATSGRR